MPILEDLYNILGEDEKTKKINSICKGVIKIF